MSNTVIRVEGLGKRYRIGRRIERYQTLRDTLADAFRSPLLRAGKLFRSLSTGAPRSDEMIWALRDISFEVKAGEVLGIIGPNGAGKSTLLKILSRITEPSAGYADTYGRIGSLLEVGTGFHPELTGRENIYLNGAILGMHKSEIEQKFDDIVAFAGVEKFIDTPVKHYSSGMHVRLAFAVAAHLEPEILLLDEVLAVGDFTFQRKCLGKMQEVAGHGRTVIFVSHNLGAVRTLCSRCLLLEEGKILADGPSDAVVDRYIDQFDQPALDSETKTIEADGGSGFQLHYTNGRDFSVFCGDPITLEFDVKAPSPLPETGAGVGITILSKRGDPLVSMSSNVQRAQTATGVSRLWKVRCEMGRLPINAGTYYVCVYIGDGMHTHARFNNAFAIRVMEHDVFGWGHSLPPASYWGPMYWAPTWKIRPVD